MSGGFVMCVYEAPSAVNYTRPLLKIEQDFDHCRAFTWLSGIWKVCFLLIAVYLAAIFAGQKYMRSRAPFKLRGPLLFWNVALACYSITATWRMLPAVVYSINAYGLFATSCTSGQPEQRQAVALWLFVFVMSKIVEFGDTAFIVLRKSPLIFLHWYHHVTVAFFVWSAGWYASPMQTYFTTMNLFVHSIMYSYYALKAMGFRIARPISMAITVLQLLQMVAGMVITGYMFYVKAAQPTCQVSGQGLAIATVIYTTYFALFLNFFYRSYGAKKPASVSNGHSKKIT